MHSGVFVHEEGAGVFPRHSERKLTSPSGGFVLGMTWVEASRPRHFEREREISCAPTPAGTREIPRSARNQRALRAVVRPFAPRRQQANARANRQEGAH